MLLKQRHDELPKLLDSVRAYIGYERDLLERLTALRQKAAGRADEGERLQAESQVSAGLGRLFAVAEN